MSGEQLLIDVAWVTLAVTAACLVVVAGGHRVGEAVYRAARWYTARWDRHDLDRQARAAYRAHRTRGAHRDW